LEVEDLKYNILIGGMAGQGVNTLTDLLQKILQRKGYYIYSHKDYMSRVRGGHNFNQIILSDSEVNSHLDSIDVILALDEITINLHKDRLNSNGYIFSDIVSAEHKSYRFIDATERAKQLGNKILRGSILLGSALSHMGIELDGLKDICQDVLKKDASLNYKAIEVGYSLAAPALSIKSPDYQNTILLDGNMAIGLGAIIGGLDIYSAYPMAPSTSIMNFLASHQHKYDYVVEQAEDEIAAINIALGSSYAGARAMTGSSGGGLSLMTESIGLSSIMEIPVVIVNVQRPGPATGLPTRTEQGDLSFMLTASQGEFPRMIISVKNHRDAIKQGFRALNLAERYKIPVIILSDQYLANASRNIPKPDLGSFNINRNIINDSNQLDGDYIPYGIDNPYGPRLVPGSIPNQVSLADNHEHNEFGNITEDIDMRNKQNEKRMRKMVDLKNVVEGPTLYGSAKPEYLLIGWGSMDGPLKDATKLLDNKGYKVSSLVFGDLWPLPTDTILDLVNDHNPRLVNVEQNYTGQLKKLIAQETGILIKDSILKYDGRQLSAEEIATRFIEEVLDNEA
jgi:2-oxoglutarate ferredoxin oxidoreductase subunit alpha